MDEKIINNIKSLSIDMIHEAKSGHPGIALGAAPLIYTLYAKHLNINVTDQNWLNRDRFVLSAGHGSALLYSVLFMAGFLNINDLRQFRKAYSKTPGHPEIKTPGVDMSTGPLGQGFASAVGMAIAEAKLEQISNKMIEHNIYVLCGDGDLMEGIVNEAASIAGNLQLKNLIVLYDSNHVSLDSDTSYTFNENICTKFETMGWNSIVVKDGNNVKEIDKAITEAKKNKKPTIIEVKTTIGKGSLLENTNKVHGKDLEEEDINQLKIKLNIPPNPFYVNDDLRSYFQKQIYERVNPVYEKWNKKLQYYMDNKDKRYSFYFEKENIDLEHLKFEFNKEESTRESNYNILNKIAPYMPSMICGSADLSSSTGTYLENYDHISPNNYLGKNIFYGVREHAMGAILNGLALYNFKSIGSTFLSFSDYLKPAIRMSALMNLNVTYIFSHDSINIGEDGPTHQPIEQLASLRSIPNFTVYRPCDAHELLGCYKSILKRNEPNCIILSKVVLPVLLTSSDNIENGAYIIKDYDEFDGIIIATGTDVHTALSISDSLAKENKIYLRVVSMPSKELFEMQSDEYREQIIPKGYKKFVIESGSSYGWEGYVYNKKYLCTIDQFGISGPKEDVLRSCNFDFDSLREKILKVMK